MRWTNWAVVFYWHCSASRNLIYENPEPLNRNVYLSRCASMKWLNRRHSLKIIKCCSCFWCGCTDTSCCGYDSDVCTLENLLRVNITGVIIGQAWSCGVGESLDCKINVGQHRMQIWGAEWMTEEISTNITLEGGCWFGEDLVLILRHTVWHLLFGKPYADKYMVNFTNHKAVMCSILVLNVDKFT